MKQSMVTLALLLLTVAGVARPASDTPATSRTPVLLELFTSEGCSSCPPADRLLETLDKDQPVTGADLIVISEHVDYWNHLGWSDPFSSALYSKRQREYASHLGTEEVYTPQLVVDGRTGLVGSDRQEATSAIRQSLHDAKLAISVKASRNGTLHVDAPAQASQARKLDLYVVLASNRMQSHVERGENAGRSLSHVAVAYSFVKAGTWNSADALDRDLHADLKSADTRVIVFLQDPRTAQIVGIAQVRI